MKLEDWARLLPEDHPLLTYEDQFVTSKDLITELDKLKYEDISEGSVVAIEGKFDPASIALLIYFIDKNCIVVPISSDTRNQHEYFFSAAGVEYVLYNGVAKKVFSNKATDIKINNLRQKKAPGLIVFTSGTTGTPKAILHDLNQLTKKFSSKGKRLRTLAFLLFDHMGGFNTFCHALISGSEIVCPSSHDPETIFKTIENYKVELLPASPSFLRSAINTVDFQKFDLSSLKLITYGSELMDENTLQRLNKMFPEVDFRQTYGLSELGVFPVRTKNKNELWIQIGSDGVVTKIVNDVLHIKSQWRMIGYLNADNPFDADGFFNTKDIAKVDGNWLQIIGRDSDIINVGGKKISVGELENTFNKISYVAEVEVYSGKNPITGNHIEANIVLEKYTSKTRKEIMQDLSALLPEDFIPARLNIVEKIELTHRFKRKGRNKP